MGFYALIRLLLPVIARKSNISMSEAAMAEKLIRELHAMFQRTRYCTDKKHECTFREGSCKVIIEKGDKWQYEDIVACPYRKKIDDTPST